MLALQSLVMPLHYVFTPVSLSCSLFPKQYQLFLTPSFSLALSFWVMESLLLLCLSPAFESLCPSIMIVDLGFANVLPSLLYFRLPLKLAFYWMWWYLLIQVMVILYLTVWAHELFMNTHNVGCRSSSLLIQKRKIIIVIIFMFILLSCRTTNNECRYRCRRISTREQSLTQYYDSYYQCGGWLWRRRCHQWASCQINTSLL